MIKYILNIWRLPVLAICYYGISHDNKLLIHEDLLKFYTGQHIPQNKFIALYKKMTTDKALRSVYKFRLENHKILKGIFKIFWRPLDTIEIKAISGKIGPGFWISHNHSVITVYSAGRNFRVGPGVVVGLKQKTDCEIINPIIGNDVYICANSTVIGGITIGNNVIIGAGSVVLHDIPSNSIVAGNPARIIKQFN